MKGKIMSQPGRIAVLLIPFLMLLAACDVLSTMSGEPPATPSPEPTAVRVTIQPEIINATPQVQTPVPPITQLRVWIPPEIGARTDAGAQELSSQLREFEAENGNLSIIVEQKPVEGAGGILSYLRSGQQVAPLILPDLIALPTSILNESGVRELVFPLDNLMDMDRLADIYPAPAADVLRSNQVYGYPFATSGLTHLVYDPAIVTGTVPLRWTQFISDTNHTLVLPADSREGAMFGLQFYLAEGGSLTNEAGQPDLQVEPLTRALQQISLNKANLLQSQQMKTLEEAWQYHQLGLSEFVWTGADFFLGQRGGSAANPSVQPQGFLPVPGSTGPLVPLVNSWAWAISTPDAARQALAADLVHWLTQSDNLASWSSRSQILPAGREAMAVLADQDNYYLFTSREMERAEVLPISQSSRIFDVLGDAVFQVLTTETSPEILAETAVSALRQ
jgi:ABC-type glycerol-3-phosphate transport system substrate-binding protein